MIRTQRPRAWAFLLASAVSLGCGSAPDAEPLEVREDGLASRWAPSAQASVFAEFDLPPAGVAGGRHVVFIGSPLEGRVLAYSRRSEEHIGDLPPPEGGFILPFIMEQPERPRRIAVLDAGGLPDPSDFTPANPKIYEYEYRLTPHGGFTAELVRTVDFSGQLIGFAEDVAFLGARGTGPRALGIRHPHFDNPVAGSYLLSDAILGAIWVAEPDGTVRLGVGPRSLAPEDAIPELALCPDMPLITVGELPFLFSGSTIPGVSSLATRDGMLYFASPCAEGVFKLPLAALFDDRDPWERASDIELVSAKPSDVQVEQLMGLSFRPNAPRDPYLYAADSLQFRIIRINVHSGERDVLLHDPVLFNFPSSASFLPRLRGESPFMVVSNQQHRLTLTNDAIDEDQPVPPFLVTEVHLDRRPWRPLH